MTAPSPEVLETLRAVTADAIAELYDDPEYSGGAEAVDDLAAAEYLGFDLWDRDHIETLSGRLPTVHEKERLTNLVRELREAT